MRKCRICNHDNPAGIDRCQNCGTWIEKAVPSALVGQGQESGPASEEPIPDPNSMEGQVLALMQGQKKIEAIRLYREQTGAGLKQAKDAVEALAAKQGISPKGAGCAGMVLLIVMVLAIIGVGVWGVGLAQLTACLVLVFFGGGQDAALHRSRVAGCDSRFAQ